MQYLQEDHLRKDKTYMAGKKEETLLRFRNQTYTNEGGNTEDLQGKTRRTERSMTRNNK